jgi:LEA14-like dessication related protein
MGLTRGKVIIIAIFVAVALAFAGLIAFESLEREDITPNITVTLAAVKMKQIDVENPDLMFVQVDFSILNRTNQTLALAKIDYDMYANERMIGRGGLSLEDTPLTGRAPLFSGSSTTLPSNMQLRKSPEVLDLWDKLLNGDTSGITWRAQGVAQIESAFSIAEVEFNSTL